MTPSCREREEEVRGGKEEKKGEHYEEQDEEEEEGDIVWFCQLVVSSSRSGWADINAWPAAHSEHTHQPLQPRPFRSASSMQSQKHGTHTILASMA